MAEKQAKPVKADPVKTASKNNAPASVKVKAAKPVQAQGGSVTLRQIGSPIGRQQYQRATLIGLGLNKLNRTRTLKDSPSVRGMIEKVKHLVEVVEEHA